MNNLAVTTIQTNLYWEDSTANLHMLKEKILPLQGSQIVVLPEMFSTGFSMHPEVLAETMDGPTIMWMRDLAAEKKIILTGSIMIEENGLFFNRLIWMLPNGEAGYYDKRHLFAYAGEDKHYTPGSKRLVARVGGWRILLLTCYDLRFPVWSRQQITNGQPEYDVIIYVANWPERRNHAWRSLLVARAIENQAFVIGVNRVGNDGNGIYHSGDSMVIDPMGEILFQIAHKEEVSTHILYWERLGEVREKLPFWQDGDRFSLV
jgi:predicted amidohydrolase